MNPSLKSKAAAVIRAFKRLTYDGGMSVSEGDYHPLDRDVLKQFNRVRTLGPQKLLCYAPFKMMYFAFNGEVIACCHNRKNVLGRIQTQSLEEIWKGAPYQELRDFIAHDDLDHGCEVCKNLLISRNFGGAKNQLYDRYSLRDYPRVMEFELDNTCNLACIICNPLFSSRIPGGEKHISPYNEDFATQLIPFLPHLKEAKFYGGEPFMIPLYYRIWELMLQHNPSISILIQTNGTLCNDKVKAMLERGKFSINISIDAMDAARFEQIRQFAGFEKTMENVAYFARYCREKGTHLGIIPTPNRLNWDQLAEIVRFANRMNAGVYFNTLITPLDLALWNLDSETLGKIHQSLSSEVFEEKSTLAKANISHFHDFIRQIEAWQKAGRERESKSGKITLSNEELAKIKATFREHLTQKLSQDEADRDLLPFFDSILKRLQSDIPTDLIYPVLLRIPIEEIITELRSRDEEKLLSTAGKKLFEGGGLYALAEDVKEEYHGI
jgi:MoaA/NifB/PqqE/SkfB family radical SAM enzyme